jgi:hypothetical protein
MKQHARTWIILALMTFAASVAAEDVVGEANYNVETGRLEVSLGMNAQHLQLILADQQDSAVTIDANAAESIKDYVRSRFALLDASGQAASVNWLGQEVSNGKAWVFFEVLLPENLAGSRLRNALYFEIPEHNNNRLDFIVGDDRLVMVFGREKREIALDDINTGIAH